MHKMTFYKIGLWGILFLVTLSTWSQNSLIFHEKINWQDPIVSEEGSNQVVLLNFENCGDLNDIINVPYFTKSIKLPYSIESNVMVSITNPKYIWPTPTEHNVFDSKIKNFSINIEKYISKHQNNYFLDLRFLPVVDNEQQSFYKLEEFDIIIEFQKNTIKTLKSSLQTITYAENSVLSSGDWVKLRIEESGIHKITYSKLKEWGFNNPEKIAIYGNGGRQIPANNSDFRNDDLIENSISHYNNAIFFYGEGPVTWKYNEENKLFEHDKHNFSDYSYYFITEKETISKQLQTSHLQSSTFDNTIDYFTDYSYHEIDELNLISSGNQWFGEKFEYYGNLEYTFSFVFPNIKSITPIKFTTICAARSGESTSFEADLNGEKVGEVVLPSVVTSDHLGYFARSGKIYANGISNSNNVNITIKYNTNSSASIGYLDYLSVNADRELVFVKNELTFRNKDFISEGTWNKYSLVNNNKDIVIWDISNPLNPLLVNTQKENDYTNFIYDGSKIFDFIAFDKNGNFPEPSYVEKVTNQNLHAVPQVDYLIVCPQIFKEEAIRLGEIHKKHQQLTYVVATTKEIYNEFSSGKPDVTAIRAFAKMVYDRADGNEYKSPKNLLLFGDGSFDNRDDSDPENMILTYQSNNSLHQTNSYVSDDYLGLLDFNEGDNITSDRLDIGIGRFPVSTLEEARNAVNKSENYLSNQSLDDWKNRLTFIGDDKDGNIHMRDANRIADKIDENYPAFRLKKIFFDSYKKSSTSGNEKYPEVETEVYNTLHKGSLIMNYTGHGGPNQLAHEAIITKVDINSWKNTSKLPVFITATCEFSRFDMKEETSAGEMVFLNPVGGGIALFTTTRIVYSSLNYILNNSIYDCFFERNENGERLSFGQIMMKTKHNSGVSVNKLNFTLLGDPALKPIYPNFKVNTVSINNIPITQKLDSLKALSKNSLKGEILDGLNNKLSDFNGVVYVAIYDKKSTISTLNNNGDGVFYFDSYENVLFKGVCSVVNGEFEFEFIVPKDIKYNFNTGKISYYASSDDNREAFGAFDKIEIGGIATNIESDTKGPEINLWLNDKSFKTGQKTTPLPLLIADISDENGINTTGSGIGHDITCIIDYDRSNTIILNEYFQSDVNTYLSGSLNYLLSGLDEGRHSLTLKAWDNYNNSTEKTIEFTVDKSGDIKFYNQKVYPNPITKGDIASFYFEHDEPDLSLTVELSVYSLGGELITTEKKHVVSNYKSITPLEWVAAIDPGLYIYNLSIISESGRKGEVSGKIIVTQ